MKKTFSYNIKKVLAGTILMSLPFSFGGCEKTSLEPDNPNTTEPKKHNVELVYGDKPSTNWQNISFDTLYKYNADPTVDSIFMILEKQNQFSALSTNSLKQCATRLRDRHNVNPKKIFGKGNFEVSTEAVQNNNEIIRLLADTLGYNVITK
ncbi:MAG: hypothetical protein KBT14_04090 [Proteobacteria bacterium]|nr:hypothetical protein [Candidatus Enterousia onthequi]